MQPINNVFRRRHHLNCKESPDSQLKNKGFWVFQKFFRSFLSEAKHQAKDFSSKNEYSQIEWLLSLLER